MNRQSMNRLLTAWLVCVGFWAVGAAHGADVKQCQAKFNEAKAAAIAARKDLAEAQKAAAKAREDATKAMAAARENFKGSDEMKKAQEAVQAAQKELETAKEPVRRQLANTPSYRAAAAARDKVVNAKEGLADGASSEEKLTLMNAVSEKTAALAELEDQAFAANLACGAGQKKLADATANVKKINKDFEDSLKSGTGEVATARQAAEPAEAKLKEEQKEFGEACRKATVALAALNQALAEQAARNVVASSPASGGGCGRGGGSGLPDYMKKVPINVARK